jgi:peptidyl-prolyl cis-trans isomerase C
MRHYFPYLLALFVTCSPLSAIAQNIIEDGGVGISEPELQQIVARWTPQMRQAAADDNGDRLELLNIALGAKKIASEADKLTPESDGESYWNYVLLMRGTKQKFVLNNFMETLDIPDMSELALERYTTQKDKYAKVPESRYSSHILFQCLQGCLRFEVRQKAQVVLDELRGGADFVALVHKYSDDKGTQEKDGVFTRWIALGDTSVTPPYSGALFEIESIGEYSELVDSPFGVHIIRLDGIRETHYLPFAEVKERIVTELQNDYKKLSAKAFNARFIITDEAMIDGAAMDKIFEPYKTIK